MVPSPSVTPPALTCSAHTLSLPNVGLCYRIFFMSSFASRKDEKTSVKCLNKMLSRNPFDDDPQQLWDAKLELLCRYKALDKREMSYTATLCFHHFWKLPSSWVWILDVKMFRERSPGRRYCTRSAMKKRNDLLAGLGRLG